MVQLHFIKIILIDPHLSPDQVIIFRSRQRGQQDGFSWLQRPAEQSHHVQKWMWLLRQRRQWGSVLSLLQRTCQEAAGSSNLHPGTIQ